MEHNLKHPGSARWWLSPDGELIRCDDHEFMARQILRQQPDFIYSGVRATYDAIFAGGWIRVVQEHGRISFDAPKPLAATQIKTLRDLATERGLPLFDRLKQKLRNEAETIS